MTVSAQTDAPSVLQALVWTDQAHAREVLLEQPATCLDRPLHSPLTTAGEALFNAPAMLGGQAERAGLSCAGCHTNGRRNPWFRLDGVSAGPGTADVSSSFFSLKRANGRFDPKPIPDLALPGKISRDPASRALERFLRGLIVEEFSGDEPSENALAALASYVRAVRACEGRATEPRKLASDLELVDAGVTGAIDMLRLGDTVTATKLISGTRFRLGMISERLIARRQTGLRQQLLSASRNLSELQAQPKTGELIAWQQRFDQQVKPALRKAEPGSLYDPATVTRWFARRVAL